MDLAILNLIALATMATIARVLALIALSVITGWLLAYAAIKNRTFENIYIPMVNALESIPVLSFLPVVLVVFVSGIGGSLGVEIAADFLVFDAVSWNVWIGIYQAFKTVPEHLLEVSENYNFGFFRKMKELYIPHSIPRITSNIFSSFADAMFYISVSEVFTVGIKTYQTFGIGTEISLFLQKGDLTSVYFSLLFLGMGVAAITLLLSRLSRWAIAKYGVNTAIPIGRRGQIRKYFDQQISNFQKAQKEIHASVTKASGISPAAVNYAKRPIFVPRSKSRFRRIVDPMVKYAIWIVVAVVLGYVALWSYGIASSVPVAQWNSLFAQTPSLLYAMGVDILRVAAITLASLVVAITVGYYLATNRKANEMVAPVLQMFAAFPAPTYFPLIFIFTLPFLSNILPTFYTEVYIFILGFISCFYYVFFDFWTGVQGIPVECWEVMRNNNLGYWDRMKYVILPATFPYLITGLSSTINSAWAGLAIGEFWPNIYGTHSLVANVGMMKYVAQSTANGNLTGAVYVSLLFAVVVIAYSLIFTRNAMDLARKKYVVEEGVYSA